MARIPFSVPQIARAIWAYVGGAAGTVADRAVNTTFWNGTAVTAPNTAGTPVVDVTRWNGTTVTAPNTAGTPVVDVTRWLGTTVTADTAGYPKVTIKNGAGTGELSITAGEVAIISSIRSINPYVGTISVAASFGPGNKDVTISSVTTAKAILIPATHNADLALTFAYNTASPGVASFHGVSLAASTTMRFSDVRNTAVADDATLAYAFWVVEFK